jgi:hypothetical protein
VGSEQLEKFGIYLATKTAEPMLYPDVGQLQKTARKALMMSMSISNLGCTILRYNW